jgi:CheY-like chemotaxis protein
MHPSGGRPASEHPPPQAVLEPDALEHTGAIDLVLLDVVMPGMDGYAVCRHVREGDATRFLS